MQKKSWTGSTGRSSGCLRNAWPSAARWQSLQIETGKAVHDGEREKQKLAAVREMAAGDQNKEAVEELFTQLMTTSRRYQYSLLCARKKTPPLGFTEVEEIREGDVRVVYPGRGGRVRPRRPSAWYLRRGSRRLPCGKIRGARLRELERGQADYAVLPIENSTAGFVITNYDLLSRYDNYIVGEIYVPVDHALRGSRRSGSSLRCEDGVFPSPGADAVRESIWTSHRGLAARSAC